MGRCRDVPWLASTVPAPRPDGRSNMSALHAIAGLVAGFLAGLSLPRRSVRHGPSDRAPITWCGNCGQPTAALCHEHKREAAHRHVQK
jgi:hypothetical protein